MSEHKATVVWRARAGDDFAKGRFSRAHAWTFDGGVSIPGSASPAVVPAPLSDAAAVDPEEAFVASLSSCHMLTFLFLAYRKKFVVVSYEDAAVGHLEKGANGVPWVSKVVLNPKIVYGPGPAPSAEETAQLHHDAHVQCFISNSVKTEVVVAVSA